MPLESSQISDRRDGFERAFAAAELRRPHDLVRLNAGGDESIKKITRELLQRPDPATAIIASDGLIGVSPCGGDYHNPMSASRRPGPGRPGATRWPRGARIFASGKR